MTVSIRLVILGLLALALSGCQAGTGSTTERITVIEPMPSPTAEGTTREGTMDAGGGGNGLDGKPLESYRVDVTGLDAYKTRVEPLIAYFSDSFPELAQDLLHISIHRNWYIVPVKLNELSNAMIGTFFESDQLAIQNTGEVWLSQTHFEEMELHAQAQLLIHELVMGIRILRIASLLDECLNMAGFHLLEPYVDQKAYKENRKRCFRQFNQKGFVDNLINSEALKLKSSDYQAIRQLTLALSQPIEDIDVDELKMIFNSKLGRGYTVAELEEELEDGELQASQ